MVIARGCIMATPWCRHGCAVIAIIVFMAWPCMSHHRRLHRVLPSPSLSCCDGIFHVCLVILIFVVLVWMRCCCCLHLCCSCMDTLCGPTLLLHRGGLYWHGNAVATLPPPPDVPGVETNMSMTTNAPDIIRMPRKQMKPPDSPIGPAKRTQTTPNGHCSHAEASSVHTDV